MAPPARPLPLQGFSTLDLLRSHSLAELASPQSFAGSAGPRLLRLQSALPDHKEAFAATPMTPTRTLAKGASLRSLFRNGGSPRRIHMPSSSLCGTLLWGKASRLQALYARCPRQRYKRPGHLSWDRWGRSAPTRRAKDSGPAELLRAKARHRAPEVPWPICPSREASLQFPGGMHHGSTPEHLAERQ